MKREESYWKAIECRDSSQDGVFFYGVITTGIYCKPSCASRRPLRKNVRFYATSDAAEQDGLRACNRCHPNKVAADAAVAAVQKFVAELRQRPNDTLRLKEMAASAGLSPFHFHRVFKRVVGITPKKYMDGLRMTALKRELKGGADVAGSVYASGFGSSSRVYEKSNAQLGMTPAQYRAGGKGVVVTYASVPSPLGLMMLGATDRGLCFLHFGETHSSLLAVLRREYPRAALEPMVKPYPLEFQRWIGALDEYMQGTSTSLNLPVDVRATAFQLRVWNYLQSIPYGEVQSYSEIATRLGTPKAVRAVANACAANHVALLIPCHRVIRQSGELGGYRWGLARKRSLLDLESNRGKASV